MTKVALLLISVLLSMPLFSQHKVGKDGIDMNTCAGAINIFDDDEYTLQFNGGSDDLLAAYPSLSSVNSGNTLWCSYIAPASGDLDFTASVPSGYIQMIMFQPESNDICDDIQYGVAEIKRMIVSQHNSSVGLSKDVDSNYLYSFHMEAGEKVYLVFSTNEKEEKLLNLNWDFVPEQVSMNQIREVDRREDDFAPTLSFKIRDKESGMPIIAGLVLEGHRNLEGMYVGSDFYFNIEHTTDLIVSCDVEGYFFHDSIYEIHGYEDHEIEIDLEKVASGKSLQIEEIQFVPGTSEILKSSEPKLRRLKDFLALNSELEVEIQGHVFSMGENSFAGQKISEARAKRVMKYLVDNGIDRSRLTAVGYGNTRPIYPNPVRTYQEQANRRVEILVK